MKGNVIHASALRSGLHKYLKRADASNLTGMGFSILTVTEKFSSTAEGETALVLLSGKGTVECQGTKTAIERGSLFDENPYTILIPDNTPFEILPTKAMEFAVVTAEASALTEAKVFTPEQVSVERRGIGQLENSSYRLVKTVFDHSTLPESNLVIGEVINQPGRWSSYPPHHHPQPELYFYRFLPEQGYGFSQLGEHAVKVRQNSLVIITGSLDHPQVSAPGYAMWYLWIVRHLPGNPYTGFEFDKAHEWTLDKEAKVWSIDSVKSE